MSTSTATAREKLLSTVGLCARARKLVIGTPAVCDALRRSKIGTAVVLEASDTSANTHEKLRSKCAYYRATLYRIPADTAALGRAVGKTGAVAAVAVTDEQMLRAISPHLPVPEPLPEKPLPGKREETDGTDNVTANEFPESP